MCATAPSWIKLKSAHYYKIFCIVRVCENSCVCVLIVHKKETVTCSKINKWSLFLFAVRGTSQSASSRPNRIVTQSQGTPRQSSWSHESRVSTSSTSTALSFYLSLPDPMKAWSTTNTTALTWAFSSWQWLARWFVPHLSTWTGATYRGYLVSHICGGILLPIKVWNAPLFAPKTVSVKPN